MAHLSGVVLACDTCLGNRPSRKPYLAIGGLLAVTGAGWCVVQASVSARLRRWAVAGAAGFVIVLAAIASVIVVPVGPAGASCSSAVTATAMRHFGPTSYWDRSGCAAAGWRRIHQAQMVGALGAVAGIGAAAVTKWRLRPPARRPGASALNGPST